MSKWECKKGKDLVDSVLSGVDVKILEKNNTHLYIPFVSITVKNNYVVGTQPYHKSSASLENHYEKERKDYEPYNCVLCYGNNGSGEVHRESL